MTSDTAATESYKLVIGNEASDLDSIISAISYAYIATLGRNELTLPIVPVPRADLPLRTEVTYLFDLVGVDQDALIFVDEIIPLLEEKKANSTLQIVLVDHNYPSGYISDYRDNVVRIIDHHIDTENYYEHLGNLKKIEMVGSASTLVANIAIEEFDSLSELDNDILTLLLATILLDTINMDRNMGRGVDADEFVINELKKFVERENLFEDTQNAKFDIAKLTTNQLLRKDYKEFASGDQKYGISSITGTSLTNWVSRDTKILIGIDEYSKSRDCDIFFVMTAFVVDDVFQREVLIASGDEELFNTVLQEFVSSDLNLVELELANIEDCGLYFRTFTQNNIKASRKVIQPLVAAVLETLIQ
eukprot:TRINITY_DN2149_c0_g1_i2.p1 TRINITY_DN2149_c0_g1~~TRINITY_DN2149_c0_g1_i2.p1  ORF type:complete len:376 (-),score=86.22 TRINITY_DN2149_c0_g1_i2:44-1126(-)